MKVKAFIQHKDKNCNKMVLQALVPFVTLKESVLFTNRTNPNSRETSIENLSKSSYEYYQRRIDMKRIADIEQFIVESIQEEMNGTILATLFPSSTILAIADDENEVNKIEGEDCCEIDFKSNVFIVDGQHRMMAMCRLYDKMIKNPSLFDSEIINYLNQYKFNCTILVNYDLWEQGQVFINVNFKQKAVNKSLYYEIFGSEYRENRSDWRRNKIYIAHTIVKELNEHKDSPFFNRIKMLGTGAGYISQAFIVESLQPKFNAFEIWNLNSDDACISAFEHSFFGTELLSFFVAIKRLLPKYWPSEDEVKGTLICKTTGIGAFIRLMSLVRDPENETILAALRKSAQKHEVCEEYVAMVCRILSPLKNHEDRLFGPESEFTGGSGKATEVKLYRKMLYLIENANASDNSINIKMPDELTIADAAEQLQDFLWQNVIDDLDCLAHHYEVDDISDFEVETCEKAIDSYRLTCNFNVTVDLFMDNEDNIGFPMTFPAKCDCVFDIKSGKAELDSEDVSISVNTDSFYE